jgi:hypothetical protein
MAIVRAMRDIGAIRKGRHPASESAPTPEQRHMAFWISIASWGVLTSGIFLSMAFTPEFQFLFGLMAAFGRSVHRENTLPPSAAPAAPVAARLTGRTVASYALGS